MPSKSRGKAVHIAKNGAIADGDANDDAVGAASASLPSWPPLLPLVPTEALCLETLLPGQIVLIRNLFTSSLCNKYIVFLSSLSLTTTPTKAKPGNAMRVNDRYEVHDMSFAQRLWSSTGLEHVVTKAMEISQESSQTPRSKALWGGELWGLNPRIRIYRYRKGHRFGPHCRHFPF